MKKINKINCFKLSSKYGDNNVFGQPKKVRSFVIVEIVLSNGIKGYGESYQSAYVPEVSHFIIKFLSNYFINMDIDLAIKKIINFRIPFVTQTGLVKGLMSSLEISFYDAKARCEKKPLFKLLNSKTKRIKVKSYASGGSVIFKEKQLNEDVKIIKKQGFDSYKMRIGYYKFKEDLKRINFIKKKFEKTKVKIMIDAIMGTLNIWNKNIAIQNIKILNDYKFNWIEEPLPPEQINDYKKLKEISKNPIAIGESFTSYREFEYAIKLKCCDVIQPDVTQLGINDMLKVINLAKKNKIKVCLHVWGSTISLLSNLHIAMAFNYIDQIEYPLVKLKFLDKITQNNIYIANSHLSFKNLKPGLGLNVNKKILNKFKFIKSSGYKL